MIIQCDHCSAKFRIDDAKLANGAVKVRCAKCKEVFVVEGEGKLSEAVQAPQAIVPPPPPADFPSDSFDDNTDFSFDQEQSPAASAAAAPSSFADEFDWKDTSINSDTPDPLSAFDGSSFGTEFTANKVPQVQAAPEDAGNDFDFGDINLHSSPAAVTPPAQAPPQNDFSIDFGEVSFSDAPQPANLPSGSGPESNDFSFDASPTDDLSPAAGNDDLLLSFSADEPKSPDSPPEGNGVNFGDFSFGDMVDDAKTEQVSTHVQQPLSEKDFVPAAFQPTLDEEQVPTSIASRKKSGFRFPLFLILGAIVLVVALAGAGLFFFGGPKAFSKMGLGFLVEKNDEEGSMAIRNILASYIVNSSAGELFVVRGEAINNFKKPRASVQVKVSILGPGGTVLVSKSVFCGNSLSNEQLVALPLAKIEEAMNNQFGDSLANMGVKPGNAIPFVVAIGAIPKGATDYSVQIAGSTGATQ